MSSTPVKPTAEPEPVAKPELAEQAAKVRAMLDRWAAEDVSGEPDWDVEDIEPLRFREVVIEPDGEPVSSPTPAPKPPGRPRSAGR
jgi:hypothetical protein